MALCNTAYLAVICDAAVGQHVGLGNVGSAAVGVLHYRHILQQILPAHDTRGIGLRNIGLRKWNKVYDKTNKCKARCAAEFRRSS